MTVVGLEAYCAIQSQVTYKVKSLIYAREA